MKKKQYWLMNIKVAKMQCIHLNLRFLKKAKRQLKQGENRVETNLLFMSNSTKNLKIEPKDKKKILNKSNF